MYPLYESPPLKIGRLIGITVFVWAMILLGAGAAQARLICFNCGGDHATIACNDQAAKDLMRQISELDALQAAINRNWDERIELANGATTTLRDQFPALYQQWLSLWLQWQDAKQKLLDLKNKNQSGSGGSGGGGGGGGGATGGGGNSGGGAGSTGGIPSGPTGDPTMDRLIREGQAALISARQTSDYTHVNQILADLLKKVTPGTAIYAEVDKYAKEVEKYLEALRKGSSGIPGQVRDLNAKIAAEAKALAEKLGNLPMIPENSPKLNTSGFDLDHLDEPVRLPAQPGGGASAYKTLREMEYERLQRELKEADDNGQKAKAFETTLEQMIDRAKLSAVDWKRPTRVVHDAMILGIMTDQKEADESMRSMINPFTDAPYAAQDKGQALGLSFGIGQDAVSEIAGRGIPDDLTLGAMTLGSPQGQALIHALNGTKIERALVHSNGATVTEALIRKGVIQVDELDIAGGDRSLVSGASLQELLSTGKVKRVVVWINPGDPVPMASANPVTTAAELYRDVNQGITDFATGARANSPDARVEYRMLKGDQYQGQRIPLDENHLPDLDHLMDAHYLSTYVANMRIWYREHPGK